MEVLKGGNGREIIKHGDAVRRPLQPWSHSVHRVLAHLQQHGFRHCPRLLATDEQFEQLSFIEGESYDYPLQGSIASESALTSAARMLRKLHDCSALFIEQTATQKMPWMLLPRAPAEVICHGDFAPYNVALQGDLVVGIFDFDCAHPGPRSWDVAYAVYCWAPFKTKPDDKLGELEQQSQRAKLFCDAYGLANHERKLLVSEMIERLNALVGFMQSQAKRGDQQFQSNLDDGHHLAYLTDIEYLQSHRDFIYRALT